MCGIFGYVGQDQNAADLVLRGLKKLEYRGYDSWGVAVGHRDRVVVDKRIGKIGEATPDLPASAIGIGHTRWATHGGVTEHNAHPHLDCAGRLALIHNGIVSNYRELREPLVRAGHRFRSETDTEVVAHLLEECLAATPAGPEQLVAATMAAFRRLQGLNAVAVADVRTGQIAAAKSGSPLVLGWGERGHLLASDFSALLERATRSAGTARNWKAKKQRRYLVTKRPYYPSMAEITEAFKWLADRGCWRRRRIVARTTATDIVLERACTLMRERIVHDGDVGLGVY